MYHATTFDAEWPFPLAATSTTNVIPEATVVRGLGVVVGFALRSPGTSAQLAYDTALRGAMQAAASRGANALVGVTYETHAVAVHGAQTSVFFAGETAQTTVVEVVAIATAVIITPA